MSYEMYKKKYALYIFKLAITRVFKSDIRELIIFD